MIVPDCVQVEKIEELAQEVMRFSRDTLAVKLRFLNSSLSRLEQQPKMYILHFSACYNFALSYADMRPSVPVYIVALYDIALPAEINMV